MLQYGRILDLITPKKNLPVVQILVNFCFSYNKIINNNKGCREIYI